MKIYDEITKKEITNEIDTSKGYTYRDKIVTGHVNDTYEIMEDSVNEIWPDGMKRIIPGYDTYEDCLYYHAYNKDELKAIQDEKDRLAKEEAEAASKEKAEREREEKISRIDSIDAQVTYTAMMTDTLMNEEGA